MKELSKKEDIATVYKAQMFQEFARVGKTLSSPKRIELLYLLMHGKKSVETLSKASGCTVANTSKHLQVLKEARLVETQKQGTFVFYQLASNQVADLIYQIQLVSQTQLAEVQLGTARLHQAQNVTRLGLDQLDQVLSKGALLIDLRPTDEYQAGHIKAAMSLPMADIETYDMKFMSDKTLVLYCRGQVCANADLAAAYFQSLGKKTYSLDATYYDWVKFQEQN